MIYLSSPVKAGWSEGLKVLVGNGRIMMSAVMAGAEQCAWVWLALMPLWFDNRHLLHIILFRLLGRQSPAFSSVWMSTAARVQLQMDVSLCVSLCVSLLTFLKAVLSLRAWNRNKTSDFGLNLFPMPFHIDQRSKV